jgi:hypothetical protein
VYRLARPPSLVWFRFAISKLIRGRQPYQFVRKILHVIVAAKVLTT